MFRRVILFACVLGLSTTSACTARKVEVRTAPSPTGEVSIKLTNQTGQTVSVYVENAGTELFLKTVPANSTEIIPVPGIPSGSTVKLRAALADGSRSYTRDNVVLTGTYDWKVP